MPFKFIRAQLLSASLSQHARARHSSCPVLSECAYSVIRGTFLRDVTRRNQDYDLAGQQFIDRPTVAASSVQCSGVEWPPFRVVLHESTIQRDGMEASTPVSSAPAVSVPHATAEAEGAGAGPSSPRVQADAAVPEPSSSEPVDMDALVKVGKKKVSNFESHPLAIHTMRARSHAGLRRSHAGLRRSHAR